MLVTHHLIKAVAHPPPKQVSIERWHMGNENSPGSRSNCTGTMRACAIGLWSNMGAEPV